MKKGSFDLTGKAIDCRELPALGDAGKEIFRTLKLSCNGRSDDYCSFSHIADYHYFRKSVVMPDAPFSLYSTAIHEYFKTIQPSDVLGQAAIDAAMDGATIVFEGDVIPSNQGIKSYYQDGDVREWKSMQENDITLEVGGEYESIIIAYKLLDKNQPSIESKILAEKVGAKHNHYFKDVSDLDEVDVYRVCDLFEVNDPSGAKQHAIKKLLCSGQRGAKDERKDLEEARDTIIRKLAMMTEDNE